MHFPNGRFIAIEGNIGAGKTTLCQMLAKEMNAKLILEEFSDNPFLPLFYQQPERYAFPVELFFMTERHKQLQKMLLERDMFQEQVIADYIFPKTLLFAGHNLDGEELRLFQRLFETLNLSFPKPDLLVYLHRDIPHLLSNIKKRNREYELQIKEAYLKKVQDSYFTYFRSVADLPILIIDMQDLDFRTQPSIYEVVKDCLQQRYQPGVHSVRISL